jgi:transcription elongation factor Elf1
MLQRGVRQFCAPPNKIHSEETQKGMFPCNVCGKKLKNKETLCKHKKIHDNLKIPCDICSKEFSTMANLESSHHICNIYGWLVCFLAH